MKKLTKTLFIAMVLVFAGILAGCSKPIEINLAEYINLNLDGYSGIATCNPKVDHKKILSDHEEEISDDHYTNAYRMLKDIKVEADKSEGLANGDKVNISFDSIDDEVFKNECGLILKYEPVEMTVSGLEELNKVNLFEHLDIRTDGYDGNGEAWIYSYGLPGEFWFVELSMEKSNKLSNGDKIKITASGYNGTDLDKALAEMGYRAESKEYTYTVSGLKDLVDYDCFAGIYLEYKGVNGEGTAEVRTDYNVPNDYSWIITYTPDKAEGLSNGDIVTVTATYTDSWTGEGIFESMEQRGCRLITDKKEYTVEGLSEPLTDTAMLDPELFETMKANDIGKIEEYFNKGEDRSVDPGSLKEVEYIGSIITYQPASGWSDEHNSLYNFYRCDVNCSFDEPRWVFWYSLYDGITKNDDGTFNIPEPKCPSDNYTVLDYSVSGELFVTPDNTHFYLGYETYEALRENHIRNEEIVVFDNVAFEEKEHIIPAFATICITDKNGLELFNMPSFNDLSTVCIYEDGTYTITIKASDFENGSEGYDGLKYFDIQLSNYLNDNKGINDISEVAISDISIICDGNDVPVNNENITPGIAEDDYIVWLYNDEMNLKGKTAVVKSKDFGFKDTLEVTFTVTGIKPRETEN